MRCKSPNSSAAKLVCFQHLRGSWLGFPWQLVWAAGPREERAEQGFPQAVCCPESNGEMAHTWSPGGGPEPHLGVSTSSWGKGLQQIWTAKFGSNQGLHQTPHL